MKNVIFAVIIIVLLTGCSYGELEFRQGCESTPRLWSEDKGAEGVYLVNSSKTKKITFTVKTIRTGSEKWLNSIYTDTYMLHPGEEVYLSCSKTYKIGENNSYRNKEFEIVGELTHKNPK